MHFCVLTTTTTTITTESTARFGASIMHLSPPLAYAAVSSKVVVLLLLLNYCFMYLPLFVGVLCLAFVLLCNK